MHSLLGYEYEFRAGTGPRTLLLLHGTGGDEAQMLPLGAEIDESASLIAVRGNVREADMRRFFKRHAEGVLDRADLKKRSAELGAFVDAARAAHELGDIVGVGFSNGANILLHLIATEPNLLRGAILFRPMSAALPDATADLVGLRVLIAAGRHDTMVPTRDAAQLESVLRSAGASVELRIADAGHGLVADDMARAREWLAALQ